MTTKDPQISEYLVRVLTNNGLSRNQALVYLACLLLGSASIWAISEASGVKRTTCYVVIKDLVEQKIASKVDGGGREMYSVLSPNELWFLISKRGKQLAEALGEMSSLNTKNHSKPSIRMFEGREGVEEAYKLTLQLPEGSEILIYGTPEIYTNYTDLVNEYLRERVTSKISARAIIADSPLGQEVTREDKRILRETRVLPPDKFPQTTEVNILPDSVFYFAHSEENPFATIIKSPQLAEEERARFELLWQIAKPIEKIKGEHGVR